MDITCLVYVCSRLIRIVMILSSVSLMLMAQNLVAHFCHPMFPVHEGRGGGGAESRSHSCGLSL
jgi:hypothetical protein